MSLLDRAQEKVIDGTNYKCWPLTFDTGRPLLIRAFKAAAPILAAAVKGEHPSEQASNALATAAGAFTDADIAAFAKAFGDASQYQDGETWVPLVVQNQSLHFAARYGAFLQWLLFAMEVNGFRDFFSGIASQAATVGMPTE